MEEGVSTGNDLNNIQEQIDFAYAVKRNTQKIRAAKRQTKGVKSANVFLAKELKSE